MEENKIEKFVRSQTQGTSVKGETIGALIQGALKGASTVLKIITKN